VIERMKVTKKSSAEVEKEYSELPVRKTGQWTEICKKVVESGKAVEVTDITVGQLAALKRTAKTFTVGVKGKDKSTAALIVPVEPKQ
jgi:3-dehydroquinate synthase class II